MQKKGKQVHFDPQLAEAVRVLKEADRKQEQHLKPPQRGDKNDGQRREKKKRDRPAKCTGCDVCCHGYAGAGVMVFIPSKYSPVHEDIVLGQVGGMFNDFGGSLDKKLDCGKDEDDIRIVMSKNGAREANEETLGLVTVTAEKLRELSSGDFKYIDIQCGSHMYRCYCIKQTSEDISPRMFRAARIGANAVMSAMDDKGRRETRKFREVKSVCRFPVLSLIESIDRETGRVAKEQIAQNEDGKEVTVKLDTRVRNVLTALFRRDREQGKKA